MAVAAATLAFAAPALPAHAGSLYEQAQATCRYMRQGYGARAAVRRALREVNYNGSSKYFGDIVVDMCGPAATAAVRRDEGRLPSAPTYSGGSTTISEDPFEF